MKWRSGPKRVKQPGRLNLAPAIVRASVRRDILQIADYLELQGGADLAQRFIDAALDTFQTLAETPRSGVECGFSKPALRRVRRWPVKSFENWLIFYLPKRDGVEILHIVHGARDIATLLDT